MALSLLFYVATIIVCLIIMKRIKSGQHTFKEDGLMVFTGLYLLLSLLLLINMLIIKSGIKAVDYIPISNHFILLLSSLTLFFGLRKKRDD